MKYHANSSKFSRLWTDMAVYLNNETQWPFAKEYAVYKYRDYNEQNLAFSKLTRVGNGKQLIVLVWPYDKVQPYVVCKLD